MTTKRPKRRWYQFSLRTLLLLVVLVAIGLSFFASWLQEARRQQMAVEKLEALGAEVWYEGEEEQVIERWARNLFGLEHGVVVGVDLSGRQVTDAGLEHLKGLTSLQDLDLTGTQVTDAGLEHLKALTSLQVLDLSGTQVTDAGLEHLKGSTSLWKLNLSGTQVSDAGLEDLKGLTSLWDLDLSSTQVSEEGVRKLDAVLPECDITH
jgi:uncharacterized protein YjbI with pentapeptide repeats